MFSQVPESIAYSQMLKFVSKTDRTYMANFKSLVQQGSHFLLQGTLLLSESEREAVLDQSDVQLLLLF